MKWAPPVAKAAHVAEIEAAYEGHIDDLRMIYGGKKQIQKKATAQGLKKMLREAAATRKRDHG